jgi:MOSC domain-containing protein YiiM
MAPRLVSVNIGLPREITWHGKIVRTGIWKSPVVGRVIVRKLNIDGDGQGDLAGHGGVNRAVMVYQLDSYRYWERQLSRTDFSYGQFGENFTVEGLPDVEVSIGDRYRIGTALFEVSQPRVTCYRLGIRLDEPQMAALLVAHHRPGFYFRVLEEGEVGAGDEIVKVAEGAERMNVAEMVAQIFARRDFLTAHWNDKGQTDWLHNAEIDLVRGHARLEGERKIIVTEKNGSTINLAARHAIAVCTGSRAAIPATPGLAEAKPWTSREATSAREAPKRLAIIGGGVVACEMATAWSRLGTQEVTIIQRGTRLIPNCEPFAAPDWRAQWVERIPELTDAWLC